MFNRRIIACLCCLFAFMLVITGCTQTPSSPTATTNTSSGTSSGTTSGTTDDTDTATDEAQEPGDSVYATPMHFSVGNIGDDSFDYSSDAIYQEYANMFNFTWDVYMVNWDGWVEKSRLWINSGDMPDVLIWPFNFPEYEQYVSAGMLGALPQGWEDRYPQLLDCQIKTGIKDLVTMDGTQYVLPRVTFYHFSPVETIMYHGSVIYRKDWLEKLGMGPWEDGSLISLDQMKEYLDGAMNNNPDGLPAGSVTGMTNEYGNVLRLFVSMYNEGYGSFYKENGQYVWGPAQPSTLEGIKLVRELYLSGYIDPDFYMISDKVHGDKFNAGTAAMFFDDMTTGGLNNIFTNFGTANPELGDPMNNVGLVNIAGPDGKWHGTQDPNSWSGVSFSTSLDEERFERILKIFDYTAALEQQEHLRLGIEGVDYIKHAKGDYEVLRDVDPATGKWPNLNTIYPSTSVLSGFVILGDDFSFANPATPDAVKKINANQYQTKEKNSKLLPYDYEYNFYASPLKSSFSSPVADEMVRVIVGDNNDVEAEWQKFIDSQMSIVQPLLDEINTVLIK